MTKERLLYIDVLKITGILMVIAQHISAFYPNIFIYYQVYGPYGIFWGYTGVALFIFASGASLTLANKNPRTIKETMIFYKSRIVRIYPAFWMSILLAIAVYSWPNDYTLWDMFTTFCGFHEYLVLFGYAGSNLNLSWWFIGLIMILYLLYPFLSRAMNSQPEITITVSAMVSIASLLILMTESFNSYILHMDPQNLGNLQYRFPLGWLFYMVLGMYTAKKEIYPHIYNNYKSILFMADLSFFIYLAHGSLIHIAKGNLGVFAVMTVAFALMLYSFDLEVKKIDLTSLIDPWITRFRVLLQKSGSFAKKL